MSIKQVAAFVIVSCLSVGCGSIPGDRLSAEMVLDPGTSRLDGWFSTKGEWILFSTRSFEEYSPFDRDEDQKCVSLINGTGSERTRYRALEGERVVVSGFTVRYDDLSNGDSAHDRLLSKKYFNNEPVENFCLRDFVFVANRIEPAR